jgi:hypothetical protein
MTTFHLDISKTEMEILIAMLIVQQQLEEGTFSLVEISRIANLDYVSNVLREKQWLLKHRIIVQDDDSNKYAISFDNIAHLLFYSSNMDIIYNFAYSYMAFGPPKEKE